MANTALSPLVALVGPTGSGKSDLAIHLASSLGGEIVNCDSVQIYRYFDIGSAKPPPRERLGIPHHLLDVADPDSVYTAGEYARQGRQVLREIAGRGQVPIVVGGTGFYLKALLEGLFAGPERDADLRSRLAARERRRPRSLHRLLRRFDPAAAARIHERDVNKTMRALEVCLLSRRPISALFAQGREVLEGFATLKIGLDPPRTALYERLNERARRMFEAGLIEETQRILGMGYDTSAKPFDSLGYRQALEFLQSQYTLEEAIASTQQETRQYAKRQWTWFRRDPEVRWLAGFGADEHVRQAALKAARELVSACG